MEEELKIFFFDSYAFFEIRKGNPNYKEYTKGIVIATTKLNLMEFHYGLINLIGKEKADEYYDRYKDFAIEIEDNIFKSANEFKFKNKQKNLSYIDCIGYILAKSKGIKFLTGDKEFMNMENVEFVK